MSFPMPVGLSDRSTSSLWRAPCRTSLTDTSRFERVTWTVSPNLGVSSTRVVRQPFASIRWISSKACHWTNALERGWRSGCAGPSILPRSTHFERTCFASKRITTYFCLSFTTLCPTRGPSASCDMSWLHSTRVERRGPIQTFASSPCSTRTMPCGSGSEAAHARVDAQLAFWREHIRDVPPLELPTDRARPSVQSMAGARHDFEFDAHLTSRLRAIARAQESTLFTALLAGFATLLARYSGQQRFAIGSPFAHRTRLETEELLGLFVNTLALRVDLSGYPSARQMIRRMREETLAAHVNQDVPFERLVDQRARDLSRSPIFQVMFVLQNAPAEKASLGPLQVSRFSFDPEVSKFDLTLTFLEADGELSGSFEFATALFDQTTIVRMTDHLRQIFESTVAHPDRDVHMLPLLDAAERHRIVRDWGESPITTAHDTTLDALFEQQVARAPNAVALLMGSRTLTYAQLDADANRLARALLNRGLEGRVIGICLEPGVELVVSLLATLKAGCSYVPLDPNYPPSRLAFVLDDAGAHWVLCCERGPLPSDAELLFYDKLVAEGAGQPSLCTKRAAHPDAVLAVIYTSGSTGTPNGVLATHRSFVNRMQWMWQQYPYRFGERACMKTSLGFVDSIAELFAPLLEGVPVVLVPRYTARDIEALVRTLGDAAVTRLVVVPSLLRSMLHLYPDLAQRLPKLWHWTVSGEALSGALVAVFRTVLHDRILLNLYGSSEVAADVTYDEASARDPRSPVRIGKPIANVRVLVVDEEGQPVPIGVVGEVWVGGVALAHGYQGLPEQTAEKFVPDAFGDPGGRLYCTGDRGRWLSDGTLEYVGRRDHQVKVRGMRVELGEVQAVLQAQSGVRECVVVGRSAADGTTQVAGYVTPASLDMSTLQRALAASLPEHMVPAFLVGLDALPLLPSGKVDRKALPEPDARSASAHEHVAPRTPIEETVAGIWQELLGLQRVGVHDNFFALGGHSLLAVRVIARLRTTISVELPVRALFDSPTLGRLAEQVQRAAHVDGRGYRCDRAGAAHGVLAAVIRGGASLVLGAIRAGLGDLRDCVRAPDSRSHGRNGPAGGVGGARGASRGVADAVRLHEDGAVPRYRRTAGVHAGTGDGGSRG